MEEELLKCVMKMVWMISVFCWEEGLESFYWFWGVGCGGILWDVLVWICWCIEGDFWCSWWSFWRFGDWVGICVDVVWFCWRFGRRDVVGYVYGLCSFWDDVVFLLFLVCCFGMFWMFFLFEFLCLCRVVLLCLWIVVWVGSIFLWFLFLFCVIIYVY